MQGTLAGVDLSCESGFVGTAICGGINCDCAIAVIGALLVVFVLMFFFARFADSSFMPATLLFVFGSFGTNFI